MKKISLEKKLCVNALISGLDQSKEEIEETGLNNIIYLHPYLKRMLYSQRISNYLIKEEIELLKKYSRNERTSHKRKYGG